MNGDKIKTKYDKINVFMKWFQFSCVRTYLQLDVM